MTPIISLIVILGPARAPLNANQVFYAPTSLLFSRLGKRDPATVRETGLSFLRPGFTKIWVDKGGPGMRQVRFFLDRQIGWKEFLSELGLNSKQAVSRGGSVPLSPIPLLRNRKLIAGVKGLPKGSWAVEYIEYAVADKEKLRRLKPQITSSPVGEQRLRLIRSCYDWKSELQFAKSQAN